MVKHNKLVQLLCVSISLIVALSTPIHAIAQSSPNPSLCRQAGIVFGFFNGVQTTPSQAHFALEEFAILHGYTSSTGEAIRYELFYNYSEKLSEKYDDFVETFEQRLREQEGLLQGRYELFFDALQGNGAWWEKIIDSVPAVAGILKGLVDWWQASFVELISAGFTNPPSAVNYAEHRGRLDTLMIEGKKLLLVAHSQGNLFVNAAYDHVRTKYDAESVKVVHIAPASPRLTGKHILADQDSVINGLRVAGSVASITDFIPGYRDRPPGSNGRRDFVAHGLIEIYLNQRLDISKRVKNYINEALTTLVTPPAEATSGFFSATLTWDGSGDVDLHTFEPSGSHVFYRQLQGVSGFLDVDNTVANGPEHYFASCDSNVLQTGTYQIAVSNFARADGRKATVQIASWSDGVLLTKSVTLGSATGDIPSVTLFNVVVSRNAQTGKYSVAVN